MNFSQRLDEIFTKESVDNMRVSATFGKRGNRRNSQERMTPGTITLGYYGDLFMASEVSPKGITVTMNGKPVSDLQPMIKEVEKVLDRDNASIENIREYTLMLMYAKPLHHMDLARYAMEYSALKEVVKKIQELGDQITDAGAFLNLYHHIWAKHDEVLEKFEKQGHRGGLINAGRIFKDVKGISFYDKAPSDAKILEIIKMCNETPKGYVVEELEGANQFPLGDRNFKQKGNELDELRATQIAKAELKKKKFDPSVPKVMQRSNNDDPMKRWMS
jgi:hypothetical protein